MPQAREGTNHALSFAGLPEFSGIAGIVAHAAQEVRWRSAFPGLANAGRGFASDRLAPEPGPATLRRPQPTGTSAPPPATSGQVTPVTFQPVASPRSQMEQLPQPMPVGPGGSAPDTNLAPKTLTVPGTAGPADLWGGPIPPWNGGAAFPPQVGRHYPAAECTWTALPSGAIVEATPVGLLR